MTEPGTRMLTSGFKFRRLVVGKGNVRVDLDWFLEGRNGTYNHTDPADAPLLHFTVQQHTEPVPLKVLGGQLIKGYPGGWQWADVEDGSYRTQLRVMDPRSKLAWAAQFILEMLADPIEKGEPITKFCKTLSAITAEGLTLRTR